MDLERMAAFVAERIFYAYGPTLISEDERGNQSAIEQADFAKSVVAACQRFQDESFVPLRDPSESQRNYVHKSVGSKIQGAWKRKIRNFETQSFGPQIIRDKEAT